MRSSFNKPHRLLPWIALLGFAWAVVATLARALRWPNDWAEAHWLISYQFGFIKRALPGSLLRWACPAMSPPEAVEGLIAIASAAGLAALVLMFLGAGLRMGRSTNWDRFTLLSVAAFLTSPYFVMSAHLIGYYDQLIMVVTLAACWCVLKNWPELAALLLGIGVLIHENILLLGLPCVLFAAGLTLAGRRPCAWHAFVRHATPLVVPLAVFLVQNIHQSTHVEMSVLRPELKAHILGFPFVERGRHDMVSKAYTTPFSFYLKTQSPEFGKRILDPENAVRNGFTVVLLLTCTLRALRRGPWPGLFLAAAVAVTVAPLLLHLIAWDTARFWTFPCAAAFLVAWCAHETRPDLAASAGRWNHLATLPLLVVGFNVMIRTDLMDRLQERFTDSGRVLLYLPALCILALVAGGAFEEKPVSTDHGD